MDDSFKQAIVEEWVVQITDPSERVELPSSCDAILSGFEDHLMKF